MVAAFKAKRWFKDFSVWLPIPLRLTFPAATVSTELYAEKFDIGLFRRSHLDGVSVGIVLS